MMTERTTPSHKGWRKVFDKKFKKGTEVVIEDDQGKFVWGRITHINDYGIGLKGFGLSVGQDVGKTERFMRWHEIVFIAQDGFPVKELSDANYSQAVELASEERESEMRKQIIRLIDEARNNPNPAPQSKPSLPDTPLPLSRSGKNDNTLEKIGKGIGAGFGFAVGGVKMIGEGLRSIFGESDKKPKRKPRPIHNVGFGCPFVAEDVYIEGIIEPGKNYGYWGEDDEETLVLTSKDGATMFSYDMDHIFWPR